MFRLPGAAQIVMRNPAVLELLRNNRFRRCISVCCLVVSGSTGSLTRFRNDLARARRVWGRLPCDIEIREGTFTTVNDSTLLDHPDWNCTGAQTAAAQRLTQMRGSCADADIVAFYVGSMGGALAGCGGSGLANGRPGIVLTDNASRNTFAHEIGHLLLGAQHANDASFGMENPGVDAITNVMYTPSGNITVDPPRVTDVQCNRLSISRVCLVPRIRVLGARTTATGTDVTAETVLPAAAPPTTPLESVRLLLQRDEDDGLELVVSMGQSVVPLMLMLINDPDLQVRARAGVVLARLTGPAAVQTLRPLAQTDPSPVVRLVTVNALARFAGAAAEPIVLGALQDPSSRVRIVALRSLVAVQTPAARMALEQAVIREPDLQIRELARRLAMGLGG